MTALDVVKTDIPLAELGMHRRPFEVVVTVPREDGGEPLAKLAVIKFPPHCLPFYRHVRLSWVKLEPRDDRCPRPSGPPKIYASRRGPPRAHHVR
jgi:hypothetical protein